MTHARLDPARRLIGGSASAVPTPALLVEIAVVRDNIAEMARRMATVPAALRPHAKIHKSPVFGQMQIDAGAIGLTTATVSEASAMVAAGLTEILVCNQVVGTVKAAELARLAGLANITVLVESEVNADRSRTPPSRPGPRSAFWSSSTSACTGRASVASTPPSPSRSGSSGRRG